MGPVVSCTTLYHYLGERDNQLCIDTVINPDLYGSPVCKKRAGFLAGAFGRASDDRLESNCSRSSYKDSLILLTLDCKEEKYLFALLRKDGKWDIFTDTSTEKYFESGRLSERERCIDKYYDSDYSVPKEVAEKIISDFNQGIMDRERRLQQDAANSAAAEESAKAKKRDLIARFFG